MAHLECRNRREYQMLWRWPFADGKLTPAERTSERIVY
jgi:hypothetical protein